MHKSLLSYVELQQNFLPIMGMLVREFESRLGTKVYSGGRFSIRALLNKKFFYFQGKFHAKNIEES